MSFLFVLVHVLLGLQIADKIKTNSIFSSAKVRRHEQLLNLQVESFGDLDKNMTRKNGNSTVTQQIILRSDKCSKIVEKEQDAS